MMNALEKFDLPLTERQLQIVRLAAEGLTHQEMAKVLRISRRSVQKHIIAIYDMLCLCGAIHVLAEVFIGVLAGKPALVKRLEEMRK